MPLGLWPWLVFQQQAGIQFAAGLQIEPSPRSEPNTGLRAPPRRQYMPWPECRESGHLTFSLFSWHRTTLVINPLAVN
jgi:hypothetical protein